MINDITHYSPKEGVYLELLDKQLGSVVISVLDVKNRKRGVLILHNPFYYLLPNRVLLANIWKKIENEELKIEWESY